MMGQRREKSDIPIPWGRRSESAEMKRRISILKSDGQSMLRFVKWLVFQVKKKQKK